MTEEQQTPQTSPATPSGPATAGPAPQPLRGRERAVWIAIATVGALALLGAAVFGYGVANRRLEGARKIDTAQGLLEKADATVVAVDKVVVSEVTTDSAEQATELSPTIPAARTRLKRALRLLGEAHPSSNDDERKRITLLTDSIEARIDMLDQASAVLASTAKAARSRTFAEQGWAHAETAEGLSDQAVAQFNKLNKNAARQSATLDSQARAEFQAARSLMSQAETAFPEADFEPYLGYLDAKLAQIALSERATSAYLKGDAAKANQLAATFNAEDKRLVQVAQTLPPTVGRVVATAYERTAEAASNAYFAARERATKADDKLRRF